MTRKGIRTSAQETVVAAGKRAAEKNKILKRACPCRCYGRCYGGGFGYGCAGSGLGQGSRGDKVKKSSSRTKKKVGQKVASKKRTTLRNHHAVSAKKERLL